MEAVSHHGRNTLVGGVRERISQPHELNPFALHARQQRLSHFCKECKVMRKRDANDVVTEDLPAASLIVGQLRNTELIFPRKNGQG
jgi:hypothetical protein